MRNIALLFFIFFFQVLLNTHLMGQSVYDSIPVSYTNPIEYRLGGINVKGIQFLDSDALISISGLKIGDRLTIPGDQISSAAKKLWEQGLIGDVTIAVDK